MRIMHWYNNTMYTWMVWKAERIRSSISQNVTRANASKHREHMLMCCQMASCFGLFNMEYVCMDVYAYVCIGMYVYELSSVYVLVSPMLASPVDLDCAAAAAAAATTGVPVKQKKKKGAAAGPVLTPAERDSMIRHQFRLRICRIMGFIGTGLSVFCSLFVFSWHASHHHGLREIRELYGPTIRILGTTYTQSTADTYRHTHKHWNHGHIQSRHKNHTYNHIQYMQQRYIYPDSMPSYYL